MEKYYRNQQIIDGELDNNQVMMHLDKGKYYGLNPVGKRIWELLETPCSFEEIIEILLGEFSVNRDICISEVQDFLDKSIKYDIIKKI
ncbi:PqqD family protein [Bacteroides ihuae]|uniref:PqqD family protein n=1 Tax=Bacteroides ihuae TaxID=1852362 RepID=UPI0008DAF2D5|nr:PqqD family protein [Bacteroides ihuae]